MEGYQWGGEGGRRGEKLQVININGRYKIDRGWLRIVEGWGDKSYNCN